MSLSAPATVPAPLLSADRPPPDWRDGRLTVHVAGRDWALSREADMEALWEQIGADDFGGDERMPYWAEVWPASLLLAEWLHRHRGDIAGKRCLELGCGLGLSAMVAAAAGAKLAAMDYEERALGHARANAAANGTAPWILAADWRAPCFRPHTFDCIWGSDILYETRFYAPLTPLFRTLLAPGGRIWLSEPWRRVSEPVWGRLITDGFTVKKLHEEPVPFSNYKSTVRLFEVTV